MYRPTVRFTLGEAAATTPYQSKVGGKPYLPKNAEYPYHAEKNHPLTLVAQINFAEVPLLPGFVLRSEERRVGKECRSRWSPYH